MLTNDKPKLVSTLNGFGNFINSCGVFLFLAAVSKKAPGNFAKYAQISWSSASIAISSANLIEKKEGQEKYDASNLHKALSGISIGSGVATFLSLPFNRPLFTRVTSLWALVFMGSDNLLKNYLKEKDHTTTSNISQITQASNTLGVVASITARRFPNIIDPRFSFAGWAIVGPSNLAAEASREEQHMHNRHKHIMPLAIFGGMAGLLSLALFKKPKPMLQTSLVALGAGALTKTANHYYHHKQENPASEAMPQKSWVKRIKQNKIEAEKDIGSPF
jgi:hypothetical protein